MRMLKVRHVSVSYTHLDIIEREGGEAVMPDLIDFFQYCFYSTDFENKHFHASKNAVRLCNLAVKFVDLLRYDMSKACLLYTSSKRIK